jgi:hypothetical protein
MSYPGTLKVSSLLAAATSTGAGAGTPLVQGGRQTFQAILTGTGAVSATVLIEVSDNGSNWITQATISLSGTGSDTGGYAEDAAWIYYRANVTAISGTGASLDVIVASEV